VIALDTNVLVSAHRQDVPLHQRAAVAVRKLVEGRASWAIPLPCIGEFLSVVTGGRVFGRPSTVAQALAQLDAWVASPSATLLGETPATWPVLRDLVRDGNITGRRVHDARIAAICLGHGVRELWTADRDYGRFPALRTRNPLTAQGRG